MEIAVLTSLIFGMGHLYQGWLGAGATAASGLLFATLYLSTGSLLLPMVVHSTGNLQGTLMFWPGPREAR